MKMMQRYILADLLRVFLLLIAVLTTMLVFVGVMSEATNRGLGLAQVVQIMPYVVPSMLPFTIPATLLLTVTVVYGRIAGDLEVIAVKAAGVSPLRLLTPAFSLGLVLAVGSFGLTNYATPWAMGQMEAIVAEAFEDIFLDILASKHHLSKPDKGYSITVQGVKNRELINPTFRYRQGDHRQITVNADRAKINFDLKNRLVVVKLLNVRGGITGQGSDFGMNQREISFPMDEQISAGKPRQMTIASINEKIRSYETETQTSQLQRDQEAAMLLMTGEFHRLGGSQMVEYDHYESYAAHHNRKLKTEIHSRYAMAGSCLFFAFVGGPFAIFQARRQFITAFIMCFLPILLVYYPVTFLMANLSKTGKLDPTWAMWIPNLVLAIAGVYILRKVVQH